MTDAKVRVRMDTTQAKAQLSDLVRTGQRVAQRVGSGIRGTVGRGLGAVGLGAGLGAGAAALRGATDSGISDVVGEALGGVGKQIEEFFLGNLNEDARASRSAREETIQAFGAIAGQRGEVPPGARQFFDSVKSLRINEERGRELFETDTQFRGPGLDALIDRIMKGFGELVSMAVSALADKLNPLK